MTEKDQARLACCVRNRHASHEAFHGVAVVGGGGSGVGIRVTLVLDSVGIV